MILPLRLAGVLAACALSACAGQAPPPNNVRVSDHAVPLAQAYAAVRKHAERCYDASNVTVEEVAKRTGLFVLGAVGLVISPYAPVAMVVSVSLNHVVESAHDAEAGRAQVAIVGRVGLFKGTRSLIQLSRRDRGIALRTVFEDVADAQNKHAEGADGFHRMVREWLDGKPSCNNPWRRGL